MSRPNEAALAVATTELAPAEEVAEVSTATPELIRRVVFECDARGSDLAHGVVVGIDNASHVFRDADGCVVLCVPAVCPLDATPESDRAALRAMAGRAG